MDKLHPSPPILPELNDEVSKVGNDRNGSKQTTTTPSSQPSRQQPSMDSGLRSRLDSRLDSSSSDFRDTTTASLVSRRNPKSEIQGT